MMDLHMHSYYSDGICSPEDLIKKLKKIGFNFVSLTDHNGIDGITEFFLEAKKQNMKAISGVEIYTYLSAENRENKHLHLLGYNFDVKNKEFNLVLRKLQKEHTPQVENAIKILQKDKWNIKKEDVFNTKASYIGLGNLAGLLINNRENWQRILKDFDLRPRQILPITEIIGRYFFKNGTSICPEKEIDIIEAIKVIHQAGGKAVLAHPGQQLKWNEWLLVKKLKESGLDGLEAISTHHRWADIEYWQKVAHELELFITCGSDFHGDLPEEWGFSIRSQWEYFRVLECATLQDLQDSK